MVREILRRGRTLPGVEQVALGDTSALPLGHDSSSLNPMPLVHEGSPLTDTQAPRINGSTVSPEYFNLLGMSLLRGRLFNDQDVEGTPDVAHQPSRRSHLLAQPRPGGQTRSFAHRKSRRTASC